MAPLFLVLAWPFPAWCRRRFGKGGPVSEFSDVDVEEVSLDMEWASGEVVLRLWEVLSEDKENTVGDIYPAGFWLACGSGSVVAGGWSDWLDGGIWVEWLWME